MRPFAVEIHLPGSEQTKATADTIRINGASETANTENTAAPHCEEEYIITYNIYITFMNIEVLMWAAGSASEDGEIVEKERGREGGGESARGSERRV